VATAAIAIASNTIVSFEAAERECARCVGDEHDALSVQAIDERSGREIEEHVGQRLDEADDPGFRGRMRLCQHEQGKRDPRDSRPDRRHDLPAPRQDEVAVTAQRRPLRRCSDR
jgi:hypothetical protein